MTGGEVEQISASPTNHKATTQELKQNEESASPHTLLNQASSKATKLINLEKLLAEYDGGAHAGMKTRHFLRLASALNDLGYFSDFQANKKEVRINVNPTPAAPNGQIATFHTGHISGKNKGLSQKTAKTFNSVIDCLKHDNI